MRLVPPISGTRHGCFSVEPHSSQAVQACKAPPPQSAECGAVRSPQFGAETAGPSFRTGAVPLGQRASLHAVRRAQRAGIVHLSSSQMRRSTSTAGGFAKASTGRNSPGCPSVRCCRRWQSGPSSCAFLLAPTHAMSHRYLHGSSSVPSGGFRRANGQLPASGHSRGVRSIRSSTPSTGGPRPGHRPPSGGGPRAVAPQAVAPRSRLRSMGGLRRAPPVAYTGATPAVHGSV